MPDAVHSRLDHWKRQLIDLSKRNRLLNFKPTRVTTIQIVDELPTEVFRTLQLDRRAMTFLPLPEQPLQQAALLLLNEPVLALFADEPVDDVQVGLRDVGGLVQDGGRALV